MITDYRESIEGKRRFSEQKAYRESLHFQKVMQDLGIAWYNHFSNECTIDFCCCEGDCKYNHHIPSFYSHTKQIFEELFEEIKHGDKEHQDWLKNKMNEFLQKQL